MAERGLTAAMLSAIAAGALRPALFYEGEFDSGGSPAYLRLWTGVGNIDWNGNTWYGGGKLLSISPISEPSTLQAVGFSVGMAGIASADVSRALQSMRKKRSGKLWLGLFPARSLGALYFDGPSADGGSGSYVSVPDDASLQFGASQDFTIELDYNFPTGAANPYWSLGKGDAYANTTDDGGGPYPGGWGVAHWSTGDPIAPSFYIADGVNSRKAAIAAYTPRGTPARYGWVVDRTAQTLTAYKDGIAGTVTDISTIGDCSATGNALRLGAMSASRYHGSMDGLRVYARACTAAEMAQHAAGVFADETALSGKWDFEEGSGTTVADTSGNGNDGTFVNSPTWIAGFGKIDATKLIADPYLLRRGRFNIAPIHDDGETATITVRYEDRLILLEIPRMRRYTNEDQQLRLAGDLGFDQVPELQDAVDVWGKPLPPGFAPKIAAALEK